MSPLLRNRQFLSLWIGQIVSAIGDYFFWLAMPLAVRKFTGSTAMLGAAMVAVSLPNLLLGPLAGVMVDRWDRRKTMIVSDLARALIVLLCLYAHSRSTAWILILVGFLQSVFSQFFGPARGAALPLIVSGEDQLAANGLMQTTMTVSLIAGPALAGVTIQYWGLHSSFVLDSLSFLISALSIFLIAVPHARREHERSLAAVTVELRQGLSFLVSNRTLVGLMLAMSLVQLGAGSLQVIWIPFLQSTFGIGPAGLGLVDGAHGVGLLIGGLGVGVIFARCRKVTVSGAGLVLAGLAIIMIGQARALWWVLVWMVALGLLIPAISAALSTIMQMVVPNDKMGRVGGAVNAAITGAGIVSMQVAGLLGQSINLRWIYVGAGLIVSLGGLITPLLMQEPMGRAPSMPETAPIRGDRPPQELLPEE
jgi:DHA3 family macrolide efflux protein-like MFS transporter